MVQRLSFLAAPLGLVAVVGLAVPAQAQPSATRSSLALAELPREDSGTPGWTARRVRCDDPARKERKETSGDARRTDDGCTYVRERDGGLIYAIGGAVGVGGLIVGLSGSNKHDDPGG